MKPRVLVIDDEVDMLENYRRMLRARGWDCVAQSDARQAIELLQFESFDIILTDLRMPEFDGIEVLRRVRALDPAAMVVIVTAYASVETAVIAVKEGAYDYLPKPFTGDQLALLVERGLKERRLSQENDRLRRRLELRPVPQFVGVSPAAKELWEQVDRIADSDAGVFIVGETGTGKEVVARGLHARSGRVDGPFIPVDCVALPRELIEGELFGTEKGAYTSADKSRAGLFECADGGTLFLDEICELDIDLQAKLLRVLQERQFRRLGGRQLITIDIRIIAASNRDPKKAVTEGRLREDLFYRLDVVRVLVPPLRERAEDIPPLLAHFFGEFASLRSDPLDGFSSEAEQLLRRYHWPGNVRELRNVVEQSVLLAKGRFIQPGDLPRHVIEMQPATISGLDEEMGFKRARKRWVAEFERQYFQRLLDRYEGNITRTAEEAGVDRKTLYRIIREHRLL